MKKKKKKKYYHHNKGIFGYDYLSESKMPKWGLVDKISAYKLHRKLSKRADKSILG
jgi:hypothetical protein